MDITIITRGIILHQVNCKGVMGCGVALAIRNKWPKVYEKYREHYQKAKLGMIQIIPIKDDLFVVNLFAQDRYGREKRHTNYDAVESCLKKYLLGNLKTIRTCLFIFHTKWVVVTLVEIGISYIQLYKIQFQKLQ